MDFRRLTSRPIDGGRPRREEKTVEPKRSRPTQRPASSRPVQSKPEPRPAEARRVREDPVPFTVARTTKLHFYKVHKGSGEVLELLGIEGASGVAAAVADLHSEELWCLYLETARGERRLVAISEGLKELLGESI